LSAISENIVVIIHSNATNLKRWEAFLQLMDQVVEETVMDKELHGILDTYCT
jgi:hypothetical protein